MNNSQKKALIRFVIAGAAALILHKVESFVNDKADEHFPDETPQDD